MTHQGGNEIAELKKAVIEQKKANLPPEADDPALEALHQAVQRYDQLVSQLVIAVLQGWDSPVTAFELSAAQSAAAEIMQSFMSQGQRKLARYQAYLGRLDRMLALASQAQQSRDSR